MEMVGSAAVSDPIGLITMVRHSRSAKRARALHREVLALAESNQP
jgi:hypothetical protein